MEPRRTATEQPIALGIADDLRIMIESGELQPGDSLPTLHSIARDYGCSLTTARAAIGLLKGQGLISGGRGKAPTVRPPARRHERSSERHQVEKDLVREPDEIRSRRGLAEDDIGASFDDIKFEAAYSIVSADADLAKTFEIQEGTALLRRQYTHWDRQTGDLQAWSLSWLPADLIRSNPAISDPANAAWPGGTMHQLSTVGIEVDHIVDHVTGAMPTTVEAQAWDLAEGVPLLWVRRISIDTNDRVVEVTDVQYPADRTLLTFHTALKRWDKS